TKRGAQPGDVLVLSKPLGTGIVLAGGSADHKANAITTMRALNRASSEALQSIGSATHAVTDVTGFGLLGHGWEMAERSGARLVFESTAIPLYAGAHAAAGRGVRTGGDPRNRAYLEGHVRSTADETLEALAYDPQTSGGLLAVVDPAAADWLAEPANGGFVLVGRVENGGAEVVLI